MGICYKLQLDTVLKKCLKTRKREREPLSRVGDVTEKLVAIACPAGLPDREERCIVSMRREPAPQTVLRAVFRRIGVVGNKTATSTYSPSKSLASGQRLWVDPRWAHSSLVTSDV